MNEPMFESAVVLCGGASSRMGFDKSLIRLGEGWLLDSILEKLLVLFPHVMAVGSCAYTRGEFPKDGRRSEKVEEALRSGCLEFLPDSQFGKGPMMGLLEAMNHSRSRFVYMTACDMPEVSEKHIRKMKDAVMRHDRSEIVLGVTSIDIEPFQAFYLSDLKHRATRLIDENRLSLRALMDGCPEGALVKEPISDAEKGVYDNINDPASLEAYRRRLR